MMGPETQQDILRQYLHNLQTHMHALMAEMQHIGIGFAQSSDYDRLMCEFAAMSRQCAEIVSQIKRVKKAQNTWVNALRKAQNV